MKDNLLTVLKYADGARCDMAHLVLNDVFGNTWKEELNAWGYQRPNSEFWDYAFKEVKTKYPDAILLAEVYEDSGKNKISLAERIKLYKLLEENEAIINFLTQERPKEEEEEDVGEAEEEDVLLLPLFS